jgi:hypothetical protein
VEPKAIEVLSGGLFGRFGLHVQLGGGAGQQMGAFQSAIEYLLVGKFGSGEENGEFMELLFAFFGGSMAGFGGCAALFSGLALFRPFALAAQFARVGVGLAILPFEPNCFLKSLGSEL